MLNGLMEALLRRKRENKQSVMKGKNIQPARNTHFYSTQMFFENCFFSAKKNFLARNRKI